MKRPAGFTVIQAIGRVTFFEIVRDKVLYNILVCAFLLFGVGFLASRLTFVQPERVVLDFGLASVAISCAMIGVFTGATLMGREFERRTIFVALSRPISKGQFVFGKFFGLSAVILLNWILLSTAFLSILLASGGVLTSQSALILFYGLILALIQGIVMASIAVFFSTFSTTSLSVIFSIGMYLVGTNVSHLRILAAKSKSPIIGFIINMIATLLPNLENFSLGTKVTYGLPVPGVFIATSVFYGFILSCVYIWAAGMLAHRQEV